ncbi:MAG: hypothetical protein J6U10_09200 [Lachnospiraceae bacterium]|nr:hypothetical protein [Lachnospiraceae bacterium]MBP5184849.1 hypothetical protein [Lachnospiraceae bacterium]
MSFQFNKMSENRTTKDVLLNALTAVVALFLNGFGIYLTMQANIGAAPWDVFNLGLSKTLGILYGTASITVSLSILAIDILLKEPIGLAMFIDALVVGKSVDFFNFTGLIPKSENYFTGVILLFLGLVVIGYTQFLYMHASLGCGPRDTLLVGLKKRIKRVPIGVVSIGLLSTATLIGFFLGGPVGLGTILCALFQGPIMQLAFKTLSFDATKIKHQSIPESFRVLAHIKHA